MRIPLILKVNPRKLRKGGKIHLNEGNWGVSVENLDTSQVFLHYIPAFPVEGFEDQPKTTRLGRDMLGVAGPTTVQVLMDTPGSEDWISVYAERID